MVTAPHACPPLPRPIPLAARGDRLLQVDAPDAQRDRPRRRPHAVDRAFHGERLGHRPRRQRLLDGLDSVERTSARRSRQNDNAPPMTGFAVRDLVDDVHDVCGSFAIVDDTTQPWQVVTRAAVSGTSIDLFTRRRDGVASLADVARRRRRPPRRRHHAGRRRARRRGPNPVMAPTRRRRSRPRRGDASPGASAARPTTTSPASARRPGGSTRARRPSPSGCRGGRSARTSRPTTRRASGSSWAGGTRPTCRMPEFLSRRGYVVVADTPHRSTFALCSERERRGAHGARAARRR